jgi:hypothetical protein
MPKLPTYDDACEQLGGRPWLDKPETDRWFLADARVPTPPDGVAAFHDITASFDLKKRMSLATKLAIFGVAVLCAIVAVAINR